MIMDFGWSNYIHIKLVADVPAMWLYNTYTAICHYAFLWPVVQCYSDHIYWLSLQVHD